MNNNDFIHDDDDRYYHEEVMHEDYYGKMEKQTGLSHIHFRKGVL